MNRMVTSKGVLGGQGGTEIVRGAGIDTVYNLDGTRAYTLSGNVRREDYVYDAVGRVVEVKSGASAGAAGGKVGAFSYDALGRLLTQSDYNGTTGYLGGGMTYSRAVVYNDKNQIVSDDTSVHRSDDRYRTLSTYEYGDIVLNPDGSVNVAASDYALGSALEVHAKGWKNDVDGNEPDRRTVNTYHWYDGAVAATIAHTPSLSNPGTVWTTTHLYDVIGGQTQLISAYIADGRPRTVGWTNDMLGQVVRRSEKDDQTGGDPHEVWHRFSGRQMGYVGNNGNYDVTYYSSRAQRQSPPGLSSFADFDLAHDHINSYEQGSKGGVYTVQSGDTLQSIAAGLWGDASLWYKIAEVNGLTASSTLIEGQPLLIPVGVQRNENNAATYQPYDPLEVLGNTSPTSPKPKTGGCGVMGQVLLVVIAAVVAVFTAGAALAAMGVVSGGIMGGVGAIMSGGVFVGAAGASAIAAPAMIAASAIGGAVGSIVSQGVGVATGIQDKFSWNAVAMAGISAGVGAGVAKIPGLSGGKTTAIRSLQAGARGALGSAISQRIGEAIGVHDKFSWAGVAAAGVGAAFGQWAGEQLPGHAVYEANGSILDGNEATWSNTAAASGAAMIANAATRSLIEGSDFGDNINAALPDVIGQTIGNLIVGGIVGSHRTPIKPVGGEDIPPMQWTQLDEPATLPAIALDLLEEAQRRHSFYLAPGGSIRVDEVTWTWQDEGITLANPITLESTTIPRGGRDFASDYEWVYTNNSSVGLHLTRVDVLSDTDVVQNLIGDLTGGPYYEFSLSSDGPDSVTIEGLGGLTITRQMQAGPAALRDAVALWESAPEEVRFIADIAAESSGYITRSLMQSLGPEHYAEYQQMLAGDAEKIQAWSDYHVALGDWTPEMARNVAIATPIVLVALGTVVPGGRRGAPDPTNYRGRYNAHRHVQGLSRLPDDWDAHHRIPQMYRNHQEFSDFDFDAPENIAGVRGSRAEVNVHQEVTDLWDDFARQNPNATRAQIFEYRDRIDAQFQDEWWK